MSLADIETILFILGISIALLFLWIGMAMLLSAFKPNRKTDFDIWIKGSEDAIPYNPNKEYDGKFHNN